MGMSENRVYPQGNSNLVGIMISKTIGCRGTQHFQTNPYSSQGRAVFSARGHRATGLALRWVPTHPWGQMPSGAQIPWLSDGSSPASGHFFRSPRDRISLPFVRCSVGKFVASKILGPFLEVCLTSWVPQNVKLTSCFSLFQDKPALQVRFTANHQVKVNFLLVKPRVLGFLISSGN